MIATEQMFKLAPLRLLDLPDEILISIIRVLDFDALLAALYVNKHVHDLVAPFIYESVTVLHGTKALNLSHSLAKDRRRIRWIRSLLVSTRFGQEHALFNLPRYIEHMNNLQDLRLETPDCNNKKPEDRVFWIQLQDKYEQIFQRSSIAVPDRRDRLLPNLKTCVLHFVDTHTELYSLSKYSSIFLHPTLESLTISCMSTDVPERLFQDLGDLTSLRHTTNLKHLHLEECDIYPSALELILGFPKALKSLKISEGIRYDGVFRVGSSRMHGNLKPRPFSNVLVNTCKHSLESLSLALGYLRSHGQDINHTGQSLKLHELENLKSLEVSNRSLNLIRSRPTCDHDIWKRLPTSLETLKVFGVPLLPPPQNNGQAYIPLDSCVIRQKPTHGLPNLKNIVYTYEHYDNTDNEMHFNELLMNLVYNDTHGNPGQIANRFAGNINENPLFHLLQQAAAAADPPQPQPQQQPVTRNFITAAMNPNLDAPPQNIQPPRFRWRTGPRRNTNSSELSRSDTAKLSLLNVINDTLLPHFKETDTRLQINLATLPRSFIPPYLFPEEKPRVHENWFDSRRPRTAADYIGALHRKRAAVAHANAMAAARATAASRSHHTTQYNNERERARTVFMRRMRNGDLSGASSPENLSSGEDEDQESEEEVLMSIMRQERQNDAADLNDDYEVDSGDDTDTTMGSAESGNTIYVDAETDVVMTDRPTYDDNFPDNRPFFP